MLKKNYFFIFDFTIENIKENELKWVINLLIFKLFNFYIEELK